MSDARDQGGRFVAGSSGNVSGRPKGFKRVAAEIMKRTDDGAALVEWAIAMWQDPSATPAQRWDAFQWLSERGLGRAVSVIDAAIAVDTTAPTLPPNWRELSPVERARYLDAIEVPLALKEP